MPEVVVSYRHSRFTAEPEQLNHQEIWAVARDVRGQLQPDSLARALDLSGVEERLYGVSENFMRVRLDRYDLLRTGRIRAAHSN